MRQHRLFGAATCDILAIKVNALTPCFQSPSPGFGLKYFANLSGSATKASASGGAAFLVVILGQLSEYCRLSSSHFSRFGSVSGLMASTGHSGSHTPQSMHSSG